jgi:APA family basic amino acid/polyamine antiporter
LTSEPRTLKRTLTLTTAVMLVAGSMIGSGIFRKPATMAGQLLSPELLLGVWIVAGIVTFIGALTNAEIAGMFDRTGGQFVYFRHMYGNFTAYMYGWSILAVIQTGSQAGMAYAFAEYLGYFVRYPEASQVMQAWALHLPLIGDIHPFYQIGVKLTAIACIGFLTIVNYAGVRYGGLLQTIVTSIKVATILGLCVLLFAAGNGSMSNVFHNFEIPGQVRGNLLPMIGLAMSGAFWAYDGWNNVTFVSGEIRNPKRNVPRALLFGTLLVTAVYVLANIAFLHVLPIDEMRQSPLVAATAAEKVFGGAGGAIIAVAVIISTYGAVNGSILTTARVYFAMARDGLFFRPLAKVHRRFATPHVALAVQGVWSGVLVLSGTFDTITDSAMFAAWLTYMLGAAGIFVLRRKYPDTERPYRVWGYPVVPAIFVVFSALFLINSVISNTQNAMMGLALISLGVPVYFVAKMRKGGEPQVEDAP